MLYVVSTTCGRHVVAIASLQLHGLAAELLSTSVAHHHAWSMTGQCSSCPYAKEVCLIAKGMYSCDAADQNELDFCAARWRIQIGLE